MLHANPGASRDFDAIAPALAKNHRVLRLDWPGYGGSPAPPQHDLRELARALKMPTLAVSGKYDPVIPVRKDGRIAAAAIRPFLDSLATQGGGHATH